MILFGSKLVAFLNFLTFRFYTDQSNYIRLRIKNWINLQKVAQNMVWTSANDISTNLCISKSRPVFHGLL